MGEVYRARDTRLDRSVAIKVLPSHLSTDPERRQRLEREARAVSSLNHPHICTLHDIGHQDGIDFLVMEYLEGETLDRRLTKGPLHTEQVLRYGVEVADALDKAHRQGIIHRDLKPGNIMLTKSGAKLLDFGLAKLRQPRSRAVLANLSALPTERGSPLTGEGTILGTFQYMAPEQLEGKEADARTDIFAFGTVVYEMATGKKAFEGKSQASLIAAILEHEPPLVSTLQPMSPPTLDHVVRKCLAKDPEERWQSANDLASELKWIAEGGSQAGVRAPILARRKGRERLGWIVAAVLFLLLIAALTRLVTLPHETPEKARMVRFAITAPEKMTFRPSNRPAVSPDGLHVAFVASTSEGNNVLLVRSLDSLHEQVLPGTENATEPFWSPDSRLLGFFASGELKKVEITGGPPQSLCRVTLPRGAAWNRDGVIIFAPNTRGPIYQISETGGEAKPVTVLDPTRRETSHSLPAFLPDGRHFAYFVFSTQTENRGIYLGSLDSKETKRLIIADSAGTYAPGHLLFARGESLMAQPFDLKELKLSGEPFATGEQVALETVTVGQALFSVSDNGVLAFMSTSLSGSQLQWLDRGGKKFGTIASPGGYSNPALSPDGKQVAVGLTDPATRTRDIWLFDLARGTTSRFTSDPAEDLNPVWSPDGSRIMFTSDRRGHRDIYQKTVGGAGEEELFFESPQFKSVDDWSLDGRYVVYDTGSGESDLWVLPLFGERKPFPFLQTNFDERQAQISPNGRWIAYSSNEIGRPEVYVQSFPKPGSKVPISTNGGTEPRWRRDGKELFFLAGPKLMAVEVKADALTFEVGVPEVLFETALFGTTNQRNRYVVSPDGRRFLINVPREGAISSPINIVVNWAPGLKK
jgi:Tol biopolymer transport system component/predicted Ser/Thr protein kinase